MQFYSDGSQFAQDIPPFYQAVFTDSEGVDEGRLIGDLTANLIRSTASADIHVICAASDNDLLGCIIFSRLVYTDCPQSVFVMAPVAVSQTHQGQGVGAQLIRFGLDHLRHQGVDLALTYGDPAFYTRCGFQPITETQIPAPFALQYPQGWLGQAVSGDQIPTLSGPCHTVPAFNDPQFW